jgi:SAM-dependent methyltransferase
MADAQRQMLQGMVAGEADMSFKRRAESVYDFLALAPGDRVLDMGCGRGFYLNFTRYLEPAADVVGIELDPVVLETARAHVPGCSVAAGSVYRLPFAPGSFDKIMFTEVIEHIPDDAAAMSELFRVLRPGGDLAVTTPNANYPLLWDPINKVLEATGRSPIHTGPLAGIWANHVRLYTPESVARLAVDAGFEVVEMRYLTRYAFPFIHNLVYGVGKPLLERGYLPGKLATAADRFNTETKGGSWFNPIRLGLAAFNAVDALNDVDPAVADRPFLIIAVHLRRPVAAE